MEGRVKSVTPDADLSSKDCRDGACAVSKAVEAECEEMVPHDWREEIRKDSAELEEQAKVLRKLLDKHSLSRK